MNILNGINKKIKRSNKMKKLNMSNYGVEELYANEIKNLDGGVYVTTSLLSTIAFRILTSLIKNIIKNRILPSPSPI